MLTVILIRVLEFVVAWESWLKKPRKPMMTTRKSKKYRWEGFQNVDRKIL